MTPRRPPPRAVWPLLAAATAFAPAGACQTATSAAGAPGGLVAALRFALGERSARAEQQWAHVASGDATACREALRAAGVHFRALPDRASPDPRGCGIPHGVVVTRGPTGIVYEPPLQVDCSLARRLPEIEGAIQAAAAEHLGEPIARVGTFGTFACRPMRGYAAMLSEHAFGNAVDLARFAPRRGQAAVVARDYERTLTDPRGPRGRFLRAVEGRLRALDGVSHVIGPRDNDAHRDHFHVDRGWRWWRFEGDGE